MQKHKLIGNALSLKGQTQFYGGLILMLMTALQNKKQKNFYTAPGNAKTKILKGTIKKS